VSFHPAAAGEVVEIRIQFTVHMAMVEYDTITLVLRDFAGPFLETVARADLADLDGGGGVWHAIWSMTEPDYTLVLAVDCGRTVQVGQRFRLVVPASAGIITPLQGIRPDDHGLFISTTASEGPVEATPVLSVQARNPKAQTLTPKP